MPLFRRPGPCRNMKYSWRIVSQQEARPHGEHKWRHSKGQAQPRASIHCQIHEWTSFPMIAAPRLRAIPVDATWSIDGLSPVSPTQDWRCCCCFKPLKFEVASYALIDYRTTGENVCDNLNYTSSCRTKL